MPRCAVCHRRLADAAICPADGTRAGSANLESYIGDAPAWFSDCSVLGVGGFATTWRVRHTTGSYYALKWARRSSPAAHRRFTHEADVLRSLGSEPSPSLIETGVQDGRPYLLMDEIQGPTLGKMLEALKEPLPESSVRGLAALLVQSVDLLHGSAYVHRDLKPDNVFAQPKRVRLIDFGLAARLQEDTAPDSLGAGTPEYAAPEQVRGERVSRACDVYSLGVILYELVTLRLPFLGESMSLEYEHANLRPPSPSRFVSLSSELEGIILDSLNKDPRRRPTSAELLSRLGDGAGTIVSAPKAPKVKARAERAMAVLLAGSDLMISVTELESLATEFNAQVVSYRQGEVMLAWLGDSARSPIERASRLAERLEAHGSRRLCMHLEQVRLLPRQSRPSLLFGEGLEPSSDWRPDGDWQGVFKSEALAKIQSRKRLSAPFIGRKSEAQAVMRAAEHAFEKQTPTIVTLVGSPSDGKSRLIEECVKELAQCYPDLRTLAIDSHRAAEIDHGEGIMDQACFGPLCVIADDVFGFPTELLDALEYASLAAGDLPLIVLCSTDEHLASQRPNWGQRAGACEHIEIGSLSLPESQQLFEALLHPASYIPVSALDQLARACSGKVGACYELAATLHSEGYLLRQGADRYQLDIGRLSSLPTQSIHQWVAASNVARESPPMARLLCLCALLPDGFSEELVATLVDALVHKDQSEVGWPDLSVALAQWRHRDLLHFDEEGYRFPGRPIRDALKQRCNRDDELRWHRAALKYWQQSVGANAMQHRAYHAHGCGETQVACEAWISIGEEAQRCHRPVDADRAFTAALQELSESERGLRLRALCGSGWARYRMDRSSEALRSLEEATSLAADCGDTRAQISSLLESATALDWAQRFEESAEKVREALRVANASGDQLLQHRLNLGQGRSAWRAGKPGEAIPLLEDAAEAAAALGDFDCRVVALILLAPALVLHKELEQAEARFTEVIDLCRGANDLLHLCGAYGNRMFLWSARKDTESAQSDLREAMRLARQVGHPGPERVATYNLAEDIYWSGEDDEQAHALAQQAWRLAKDFLEVAVVEDALLVARTALALQQDEVAEGALQWARDALPQDRWSDTCKCFGEMIDRVLDDSTQSDWQDLLDRSKKLMGADDHLELRYWLLRRLGGELDELAMARFLREAQVAIDENPIWQLRYQQLRS